MYFSDEVPKYASLLQFVAPQPLSVVLVGSPGVREPLVQQASDRFLLAEHEPDHPSRDGSSSD